MRQTMISRIESLEEIIDAILQEVKNEGLQAELAQFREDLRAVKDAAKADEQNKKLEIKELDDALKVALKKNDKLVNMLEQTKQESINAQRKIGELEEMVDILQEPPSSYGFFSRLHDEKTADIWFDGELRKVKIGPDVKAADLEGKKGQAVLVNAPMNIIALADIESVPGAGAQIKDVLDDDTVVVERRDIDSEQVVLRPYYIEQAELKVGARVKVDKKGDFILKILPEVEVSRVKLEEIPDVTYEMIGGLSSQIEELRDTIELPFVYPDVFAEYDLKPPKGILLYGPPGCGKTMIAKAVANHLAIEMARRTGRESKSFFLPIKGPEILNKYVGESEFNIRKIFEEAKQKASDDCPVIIFFDEMDALFRLRGSGISSDVEVSIVAQLLSAIDGIEELRNVIVIGASNRQDLIDPAILRPGRLDIKIHIERPVTDEQVLDILSKYLTPNLPLDSKYLNEKDDALEVINGKLCRWYTDHLSGSKREYMPFETIEDKFNYLRVRTTKRINYCGEPITIIVDGEEINIDNRIIEVTYARGDTEVLYLKDLNSGAALENIVRRAKKAAAKMQIRKGVRGIKLKDLFQAVEEEIVQNEDLPNTTSPEDWDRIAGLKGERIVGVRSLRRVKEDLKTRSEREFSPRGRTSI